MPIELQCKTRIYQMYQNHVQLNSSFLFNLKPSPVYFHRKIGNIYNMYGVGHGDPVLTQSKLDP